MDFWDCIKNRRSVRAYDPARPVPQTLTTQLLEAAIRAPSAGNAQPWHFMVIRNSVFREALAAAAFKQGFLAQAPVVIVVCADERRAEAAYGRRGVELYMLQDTAAATMHILLAAAALGLGACWVGAFREDVVREALDLATHLRPVAMIPVGHPAEEVCPAPLRRPLEEVVTSRG